MEEIFKNSLFEIYKKPFRIFAVFLLILLIVFGINKTEITPEVFIFFLPIITGTVLIDKKRCENKNWSSILINFLIYSVIFVLNNLILHKYVNFLENKDMITDKDMFFFKLVTIILDNINYIFVFAIFYSYLKKSKSKIAITEMFKYFSEKSSNIVIIFYSLIFSMFSTVLILYGVDNSLCYNIINLFFLLFSVIFISFMLLLFKNFLLSGKTDEVILQSKEKRIKFSKKYIFGTAGAVILSIILTALCFILFIEKQSKILLISFLILPVIIETVYLDILFKFNGKKIDRIITFKKFFNMAGINLVGILIISMIFFGFYILDMNFFIYNTLILFAVPAVILNYLGLILNFQLAEAFTGKTFFISFKEGIYLSLKFMNLKVLTILIGGNVILVINLLNGIFPAVAWVWNIFVSFYLIHFYLKEKK